MGEVQSFKYREKEGALMDWLTVLIGLGILAWACSTSSSSKNNGQKKYRRSDLIIGEDKSGSGYCVYCCSQGFKVVYKGTSSECEKFLQENTY